MNFASDAARVGGSLESVYAGAKAGVIGFTKTIARETVKTGVTCNVVCPGPTDTTLIREMGEQGELPAKIVGGLDRAMPIGRLAVPDEIAYGAAVFTHDDANFITGQTLSVSGGLTMAEVAVGSSRSALLIPARSEPRLSRSPTLESHVSSTARVRLSIAVLAALVAAACGGSDDGGSAERSDLAVALGAAFVDGDTPSANQAEADCAADYIVDIVGEDRLTELGVTPDRIPPIQEVDFTDAEIGMVVGGFNTCSDLVANFEADLAEEVGEEAAACMAETLGFSVLNEVLRATFADDVAALERTSDSFSIAADFCGLS